GILGLFRALKAYPPQSANSRDSPCWTERFCFPLAPFEGGPATHEQRKRVREQDNPHRRPPAPAIQPSLPAFAPTPLGSPKPSGSVPANTTATAPRPASLADSLHHARRG